MHLQMDKVVDFNVTIHSRTSALTEVAGAGHVQSLLEKGADVEAKNWK